MPANVTRESDYAPALFPPMSRWRSVLGRIRKGEPELDKKITLYGNGTTRSSRCRWTLLELGLEFHYIDDSSLAGTAELKKIQPLGKLPAIVLMGRVFLNLLLSARTYAIFIQRKI